MATLTINTEMLVRMFLAGAANLQAKKEWINELNVFPVPDGDTGTNMTMTIMNAVKEVRALDQPSMEDVANAISKGSLVGARGNSGVILSQLLRGFCTVVKEGKEINSITLAEACDKAVHTAYKAVMKPKEGTILTVAKGISDKASEMAETTDDLEVILPAVIEYAKMVLAKTPDMLPVLKEAGVVDSGGQGLLEILHGAYDAFCGREVDYAAIEASGGGSESIGGPNLEYVDPADIEFGYCTEFIVMLDKDKEFGRKDETELVALLESIGDSIVCVAMDDVVKIHVHTEDPGLAIQKALTYGELSGIKIDNMREENREKQMKQALKSSPEQPRKSVGFIAISVGEGMKNIFTDLGVDYIIEGGQTMNPSTDDLLHAIDQVNADHIFVFPNNKNIIMAANQAASLTEDKDIIVIPTKTVPQGISAIISYLVDSDIDTNLEGMNEAITAVKTGSVTYAVRDTHINNKEIHEGDIMGINDAGICAVGQDIEATTIEMFEHLVDDDSELISIFYGSDVTEEAAMALSEKLEEIYPDLDIDTHFGGQPIYYYVVSVE